MSPDTAIKVRSPRIFVNKEPKFFLMGFGEGGRGNHYRLLAPFPYFKIYELKGGNPLK
jgi:hypothetical protein